MEPQALSNSPHISYHRLSQSSINQPVSNGTSTTFACSTDPKANCPDVFNQLVMDTEYLPPFSDYELNSGSSSSSTTPGYTDDGIGLEHFYYQDTDLLLETEQSVTQEGSSSPHETSTTATGTGKIMGPDDGLMGSSDAKPRCWEHGCNGRQFSSRSNYMRHMRERAGANDKRICPMCMAVFTRKSARDTHLVRQSCGRIRRYSNGRTRPSRVALNSSYPGMGLGDMLQGDENWLEI